MVYQIKLKQVIEDLKPLKVIGNSNLHIHQIVTLDELNQPDQIAWCSSKNLDKLNRAHSGIIIVPNLDFKINDHVTYLIFENPRLSFQRFLVHFAVEIKPHQISNTAVVPEIHKENKYLTTGHHTVIEEDVIIGKNVIIGHNTVIHSRTKIGDNVRIGANCTIGGPGFGFEKNEMGDFEFIPQIGNVILEDKVEIGDNVCIDRAAIGSTILMKNVKVDNLVHIAHGCVIGENSLIIANAMIAGSTKIGNNVWVGPSSALMNKINISDNSLIGLGAVVIKDVLPNAVMVGNPAKPLLKK